MKHKKNGKKAILIISLILVLLLAAAAVYYFFFSGREELRPLEKGSMADSPYPCSWAEQEDGSFLIRVEGDLPENASWSYFAGPDMTVEQQGNEAVFSVQPIAQGGNTIILKMREIGLPVEKGVNFSFCFVSESGKRMTGAGSGVTVVDAQTGEATASGETLYWRSSSVGSVFLHLSGSEWEIESSLGVNCIGPTVKAETVKLEVYGVENAAACSLILRSLSSREGFELNFAYKDGVLSVENCKALEWAEEPEETSWEIPTIETQEKETDDYPQELWDLYYAYEAENDPEQKAALKAQMEAMMESLRAEYQSEQSGES